MAEGGREAATPAQDRTREGVMLILASVAAMALGDAVVKLVSANLSVWQVFVLRSAFAVPCLIALGLASGYRLRPRHWGWSTLRSALLVLTWLAFYASLPVLDLAVAAVAVYTNPILTVLLAALLLRERVRPRQWLGVLLGFVGVATMLLLGGEEDATTAQTDDGAPGAASDASIGASWDASWAILLPLLAALFYSLAMILTRTRCRDEDAAALALSLHGSFILSGAVAVGALAALDLDPQVVATYPFLLEGWGPLRAADWALMAFLGLLSAAFFTGVARAYQIAPPQVVATFDYAYLPAAALWAYVLFLKAPAAATLLGMAVITAAGLLAAAPRARARTTT